MKYCSKFMVLLMQLLVVQTDDLNSNYFYQNLLTTTNKSRFLSRFSTFRTKGRSLVFYYKSQTTAPIVSMRTLYHSNRRSIGDTRKRRPIRSQDSLDFGEIYRQQMKEKWLILHTSCIHGPIYRGRRICPTSATPSRSKETRMPEDVSLCILLIGIYGTLMLFVCIVCASCLYPGSGQMYENFIRPNNIVTHSRHTVEPLQTSTESGGRSVYPQSSWSYIDNFRERHFETQWLNRDTPLTNSIGSIEQQLSVNRNFNLRRTGTALVAQRTSSLPPAYDDVIRQNQITIMMEPPPSYHDFKQKNNERV